jgi:hypothetical protein
MILISHSWFCVILWSFELASRNMYDQLAVLWDTGTCGFSILRLTDVDFWIRITILRENLQVGGRGSFDDSYHCHPRTRRQSGQQRWCRTRYTAHEGFTGESSNFCSHLAPRVLRIFASETYTPGESASFALVAPFSLCAGRLLERSFHLHVQVRPNLARFAGHSLSQ